MLVLQNGTSLRLLIATPCVLRRVPRPGEHSVLGFCGLEHPSRKYVCFLSCIAR